MVIQIHIYNANETLLDDLLSSIYLSNFDIESFSRYKNIEVKKEKVVSTIFKNKYIGEYYENEFGKPVSDKQYFNLSHSKGNVVFVMDDVPIGIDIEKIDKVEKDLIDYIANEEEKNYIRNEKQFYEIWTNKEALVKAHGTGIKLHPKKIAGLPINGKRTYEGKTYHNKTIFYDGCFITVSRQSDEDFELEIIKETIA